MVYLIDKTADNRNISLSLQKIIYDSEEEACMLDKNKSFIINGLNKVSEDLVIKNSNDREKIRILQEDFKKQTDYINSVNSRADSKYIFFKYICFGLLIIGCALGYVFYKRLGKKLVEIEYY